MPKEINVLELRKHLGEIIDEVRSTKENYVVTKNGRPAVILMDISLYNQLQKQTSQPAPVVQDPADEFIEIYTKERIADFLKEDQPK